MTQPATHYETLVPEADTARFFQLASWQATLELAEINAPHGFMRYYQNDITAVMAGSPSLWKATQYLMGNHTIAERMFRHDPSAMLHAPLRTLLYADPDGDTQLAVDQPSLLFASYDDPGIADVGRELDTLLARLIPCSAPTRPRNSSPANPADLRRWRQVRRQAPPGPRHARITQGTGT